MPNVAFRLRLEQEFLVLGQGSSSVSHNCERPAVEVQVELLQAEHN